MKKNNKSKGWLIFFVSLAVIVLLLFLTQGGNIGTRVTISGPSPSIEHLIGKNIGTKEEPKFENESEIEHIVIYDDGTGYILKKGSKYKLSSISKNCDYHFDFVYDAELTKLTEMIDEYNRAVEIHNADPANAENLWMQIKPDSRHVGVSWWQAALPWISIAVVVFLGFFLVKSIMGANSKSFTFGKTKAQIAHNVKVRFADVAGIDEEKEELQEVVEFLKNPQKFTELGAKIPKGILLVGLPGTGKTLLAKAIAGESNVPFFSISGSDFVEMFVGVGASRVRDLFEQAKKESPCIVFIDEIDAVGRQRGAGMGGGNDEREQTLNQLLVQMDGFEGNTGIIVIAATNRSDVLDPALLRPGRFDRQIYINPPDVRGREMILKIHARNKPFDASVDFKNLARMTSGFTGADLENLLNEAAIMAARENRKKITMLDVTESINKVLMGPQKRSRIITTSDKRITACHESGHAIIGKVLPHCDVVQEVSIIPRGMAAGYTLSRPDKDEAHMSYNKILDNITMMLGGRVAEELLIKDISTGASNDIERATSLARKMVTEWGMSTKLGPINFGSSGEVFLGRDYQSKIAYSEKTASEIDSEINQIVTSCYKRAKDIITSHMKQMNTMIDILLEKETIYYNEVELIMQGKSSKEILTLMEKEEIRNKAKIEVERAEAELEKIKKEQSVRIKTAEALKNGGILSAEEIEKIKVDSEKLIKSAEEKVARTKENSKPGENQNSTEEVKKDDDKVETADNQKPEKSSEEKDSSNDKKEPKKEDKKDTTKDKLTVADKKVLKKTVNKTKNENTDTKDEKED